MTPDPTHGRPSDRGLPAGDSTKRPRCRFRLVSFLAIVIGVGVWSRLGASQTPFIGKELGDILWGVMFYLWVLLVAPRISIMRAAAASILICFGIEFLKLYHAPWLDSLREDRIAGFLLGRHFNWRDLAFCVLGTLLGITLDRLTRRKRCSVKRASEHGA
jgi:glycopeptide antibiotics resistance protein